MDVPMDTVFDDPSYDPRLNDTLIGVLKTTYLMLAEEEGMRVLGMSDTEIINSMEELRKFGYIELISDDEGIRVEPVIPPPRIPKQFLRRPLKQKRHKKTTRR